VHRSTTAGFTPDAANRIATVSTTAHTDTGLAAGVYHYRVVAKDAAGNTSPPSTEAAADITEPDTTPPAVSVTAPAAGATVSGTVQVTASASDAGGVAGVRFRLDGSDLGAEDTTAPYAVSWDTTQVANGSHTLTAIARDSEGNTTTSTPVTVDVSNASTPPPAGLVAAYGFDAGSGTSLTDVTGNGHTGTISGATWTTTGKHGGALDFDGTNDLVTITDHPDLDLTTGMTLEAWINPRTVDSWQAAIVKEIPGDLAYGLYPGGPGPSGWITTTGWQTVIAPNPLPTNTWTHLALTYDGTMLRLYHNGTQVAATTHTGTITTSTNPLQLGGNTIWGEHLNGQLDDVRIYNHALTPTHITTDAGNPVN